MHPAALRGSTCIYLNYFEKYYVFSAVKQYSQVFQTRLLERKMVEITLELVQWCSWTLESLI